MYLPSELIVSWNLLHARSSEGGGEVLRVVFAGSAGREEWGQQVGRSGVSRSAEAGSAGLRRGVSRSSSGVSRSSSRGQQVVVAGSLGQRAARSQVVRDLSMNAGLVS